MLSRSITLRSVALLAIVFGWTHFDIQLMGCASAESCSSHGHDLEHHHSCNDLDGTLEKQEGVVVHHPPVSCCAQSRSSYCWCHSGKATEAHTSPCYYCRQVSQVHGLYSNFVHHSSGESGVYKATVWLSCMTLLSMLLVRQPAEASAGA